MSYGDDPQIVLPAVNDGQVGDRLLVSISFQELSVGQFVRDNCEESFEAHSRNRGQAESVCESMFGRFTRQVKNAFRKP